MTSRPVTVSPKAQPSSSSRTMVDNAHRAAAPPPLPPPPPVMCGGGGAADAVRGCIHRRLPPLSVCQSVRLTAMKIMPRTLLGSFVPLMRETIVTAHIRGSPCKVHVKLGALHPTNCPELLSSALIVVDAIRMSWMSRLGCNFYPTIIFLAHAATV